MMDRFDWPALAHDQEPLPSVLTYERGVWGKVHGAPTDYRWIAQSAGFDRDRSDLYAQLNLGAEDAPCLFQAWRNLGDRCCAINIYRSRAFDAAGRSGFLEKHVLEWRRPAGVPAVIGALLLLPVVAKMEDAIWWDRVEGALSSDPSFLLRIPPEDLPSIAIDEDQIGKAIERGSEALREAVTPDVLEQLYDQLLSARQPAYLSRLSKPLPPEALAALLLPLPREIADRISLTGWIPSKRPSFEELGRRWDVLMTSPDQSVPAIPPASHPRARQMMEALLTSDLQFPLELAFEEHPAPAPLKAIAIPRPTAPRQRDERFRPGLMLDLTAPEPNSPKILTELHQFATDPSRRWLDPEAIRKSCGELRFPSSTTASRLLFDWLAQVRDQMPSRADPKQWEVKIDLLRSAAIVLMPELPTVRKLDLPATKRRVPILFFGMVLKGRKELGRLEGLGSDTLRHLLSQSLSWSDSPFWTRKFRDWLLAWQNDSHRDIQGLISDVLNP